MDKITPSRRSANMRAIRSKDIQAGLLATKDKWQSGERFEAPTRTGSWGWDVLIVWDCETRSSDLALKLISFMNSRLGHETHSSLEN